MSYDRLAPTISSKAKNCLVAVTWVKIIGGMRIKVPLSNGLHARLCKILDARLHLPQWRNNGVAAASSDGGPTGGRGAPTVLFYFKSEGSGPDLRK